MSYEEDRWPKLSPTFRAAHNRLRQARGQETIPEPKVDLYVKPRAPAIKPFDPSDPEFIAAARAFNGGILPGAHAQGDGFTINGQEVSFALNDTERMIEKAVRMKQQAIERMPVEEGFRINGRMVR